MIENPKRLDICAKQIKVEEAIAFTRINGNPTKQPTVKLKVKYRDGKTRPTDMTLYIKDKYIMWNFLNNIAQERVLLFKDYLRWVDHIALDLMINDFILDYPDSLLHLWVQEETIVGFDGNYETQSVTQINSMKEISSYIKGKNKNYNLQNKILKYKFGNYKESALTGLYSHENNIIEVVCRAKKVHVTGRYNTGYEFIQPINSVTLKGRIYSIKVSELYSEIDKVFLALEKLDENNWDIPKTVSQSYRLKFKDRNKLERERYIGISFY